MRSIQIDFLKRFFHVALDDFELGLESGVVRIVDLLCLLDGLVDEVADGARPTRGEGLLGRGGHPLLHLVRV